MGKRHDLLFLLGLICLIISALGTTMNSYLVIDLFGGLAVIFLIAFLAVAISLGMKR